MADRALLTEADLRGALRLSHEGRELPRGSREQQEHMVRGLARLTSAQVGVWGEIVETGQLVPVFDFGWSGDAEREMFGRYVRGLVDLPGDPTVPIMMKSAPSPVIAVTRQELITDRAWYASPHVQELRRAARVDSFVYAGWRSGRGMSALGLHRAWGDLPFGERELALVRTVCEECSFWRKPPAAELLPPRLQGVLSGLQRGLSEKEIAYALQISTHTVHDHVKALHRRFGVHSRGQLLAKALRA